MAWRKWVARNTELKKIKNIQGSPVSTGAIFSRGPGQSDRKGRSWNGTQLSGHGRNHACNHAGKAHGRIQSSAIVSAQNSSRFKIWVKLEIQKHISRVREILWSFREKTSFIVQGDSLFHKSNKTVLGSNLEHAYVVHVRTKRVWTDFLQCVLKTAQYFYLSQPGSTVGFVLRKTHDETNSVFCHSFMLWVYTLFLANPLESSTSGL
jgi:hypothetical protein